MRRAAEEKLRVDDLQQQLKSAKAAAETAKQELQDYKHKATRILQVRHAVFSIRSVSIYINSSRHSLFLKAFFYIQIQNDLNYLFLLNVFFVCPFASHFFVTRLLLISLTCF